MVDDPRREIAALLRRGQASGALAASFDADAAARGIIAFFHGFVLQRLWEPELDLAACTAVFERFLESLERRHGRVTSKT